MNKYLQELTNTDAFVTPTSIALPASETTMVPIQFVPIRAGDQQCVLSLVFGTNTTAVLTDAYTCIQTEAMASG